MVKVLVIGGIKGGSGKSTLATTLALMQKRPTLFIDADYQSTSYSFFELRRKNYLHMHNVEGVTRVTGIELISYLEDYDDQYDTIVIDTGGGDTVTQRIALSKADVLLVPFVPSAFDVWTADAVDGLVYETRLQVNKKLKAYSFLNKVDARAKDWEIASEALMQYKCIAYCPLEIGQKRVWQRAAQEGKTVLEMPKAPPEARASAELLANFTETWLYAQ